MNCHILFLVKQKHFLILVGGKFLLKARLLLYCLKEAWIKQKFEIAIFLNLNNRYYFSNKTALFIFRIAQLNLINDLDFYV